MNQKSFLEVQFPIGPLSLESYKERRVSHGKVLSLGKWWGDKPIVLTRAILLGTLLPASDDPERWSDDLDIFMKLMCLDNAGMWKRKVEPLPGSLCYPQASAKERKELFEEDGERWKRGGPSDLRETLEKRVFYTLGHTAQREYCCRVEEIDGPPEESWAEINAYLGTSAKSLPELVQKLSELRYGRKLKVGDAFCGAGWIPFAAAEMGCDVFASDLSPVGTLLTWGALNLIGGDKTYCDQVKAAQELAYQKVDSWIQQNGYETSEEGWRGDIYFYCLEITVPEWNGWSIPLAPSWVIAPISKIWVELVPLEAERRFKFLVRMGGAGYSEAAKGTKREGDVVCPQPLWEMLKRSKAPAGTPRAIPYSQLIENAGGLRVWDKSDFQARVEDVLRERLYCIRWRKPDWVDERGRERQGDFIYREPTGYDVNVEKKVVDSLSAVFADWQRSGWIPSWRVEPGEKTEEPIRGRVGLIGITSLIQGSFLLQVLIPGSWTRQTRKFDQL